MLLPIDEIIRLAKSEGVTFGHGDPKIHLAYLTKLRLLPSAIRRKVGDQVSGCYPDSVIEDLKKIEQLKNSGLTYSQIKYHLDNPAMPLFVQTRPSPSPLLYLTLGLLLGFLVATINLASSSHFVDSNNLASFLTSSPKSSEPIYVIALPKQNFDKLGKITNISQLN